MKLLFLKALRMKLTRVNLTTALLFGLEMRVTHLFNRLQKSNLRVASWDLGLGESQVLSQAIECADYEAIIDDLAARKAAKILRVPVRGTLAVVVLAKQLGYVVSVREELENLVQVGLRVSPALLQQVLVLAGE